jgi:hypothetical protein
VVLVDVIPEEGKLDLRLDPSKPAGSKGGRVPGKDKRGADKGGRPDRKNDRKKDRQKDRRKGGRNRR